MDHDVFQIGDSELAVFLSELFVRLLSKVGTDEVAAVGNQKIWASFFDGTSECTFKLFWHISHVAI